MKGIRTLVVTVLLLCAAVGLGTVAYADNGKKETKKAEVIVKNPSKTEVVEKYDFNPIKFELALLPRDYDVKLAEKDGCLVISKGKIIANAKQLDWFLKKCKDGETASIRVVQYTKEGDAVIAKLQFDGTEFYGVIDNTRDEFSKKDDRKYQTFAYKYFKRFTKNGYQRYYLLNDNKVKSEQLWKDKKIDVKMLFSFKKI